MDLKQILSYYFRKDIQEAIFANSTAREVTAKFNDSFGKRPDVLQYPRDVYELAKEGATSFHASEELWSNPLALNPNLKRKELDELRIGWDLVLDIDCKYFEISRIAAYVLCKRLIVEGIKNLSLKFSGNTGFHIGIPFESFPEKVHGKLTKELFPEGPRRIAFYLKDVVKDELRATILKYFTFEQLQKLTSKSYKELTTNNNLNPYSFLDIDTILISSRHLYRMPYTLNEKSWLVSVPVIPSKVLAFNRQDAEIRNIVVKGNFLDKTNIVKGDARRLIVEAFDYSIKQEEKQEVKEYEVPSEAISEQYFPPCIKIMLEGLHDGRKRALFILLNFLSSVGYTYDEIENLAKAWNAKNREPLRETYLLGQIKYHKMQRKRMPPPNCDNKAYMIDIGVCKPDLFCAKIRNPAQYTIKKVKIVKKKE